MLEHNLYKLQKNIHENGDGVDISLCISGKWTAMSDHWSIATRIYLLICPRLIINRYAK